MAQVHVDKPTAVTAGGSMFEALAAIGAIVLAILGLTEVLPKYMAAIGTIVVGAALFLEGSALGIRANAAAGQGVQHNLLGGAAGAEVFGGAVGILLGILALFGVSETVLLPAAVIVFGASLLVSAMTFPNVSSAFGYPYGYAYNARAFPTERVGELVESPAATTPPSAFGRESDIKQIAYREMTEAATGAHVLVG